ncbi:MAG: DEAD/DEAH box helicase family protein [ANME-2 cluster archaeon]|nr:DEAD/DEAH box helicase family protein [ANME-2 cluster archaeon]
MKDKQSDIFIVDNSDSEWKVEKYLAEWCELSKKFDIATGYFEIGSLLNLDGKWQNLEKIRILMGDEVSKRTQQAFAEGLLEINSKLDNSIEGEKEENDFLNGVPAIVNGINNQKIECRVYRKKKFHAKAYITHSKFEVVGPAALVGSSNFTSPGLNQNVELNVQIKQEVQVLQDWFEKHWNEAEDVTPEILKTIKRHTQEFLPFEVYAKSLYEYFKGHELTESEWERDISKMYPILDQYQRDGYHALMKIASSYNGGFLCDGVGLGKTFIGLMLIERLLMLENKRVVLIVPKATRKPVWEFTIKNYMPKVLNGFLPFRIINHSDLTRSANSEIDWPEVLESIKEQAEVIIIDEAHHFRNRNTERYRKMFEICDNKQVFLLTATPINNSLLDIQHQIELFSREIVDYFGEAPLGIHSLKGHFMKLEKELQNTLIGNVDGSDVTIDADEAKDTLAGDDLFNALVVQRSRSYVKDSQRRTEGRDVVFPERRPPIVIDYSLKKTYGKLLTHLEEAFNKDEPLLDLVIYYPLRHYIGQDEDIDPMAEGRQRQVVGLIRTLLLKRFESSRQAFEFSCEDLLLKLLAFVRIHNEEICTRWERQHKDILEHIKQHQTERGRIQDEDSDEDYLPEELLQKVETLSYKEFDVATIIYKTLRDMDQLAVFIKDLLEIKQSKDDKLENLVKTLNENPLLKKNKVIIFTEYMTTAQYLFRELKSRGFEQVDEVDSSSKRDRGEIINCFSPYYNGLSSQEIIEMGKTDTRILISTDVLAEGLNLQDATLLINYDLHWNPVRLMQRIGRVDRRLNPDIEEKIVNDHPEYADIRGKVQYWNFLPPDELNEVLSLYEKVTSKTLRISKTFGIEGKKLLTPDDDYEALNEFNQDYEGSTTFLEEMHLEYQELIQTNPELLAKIQYLPLKVFSGKEHISPDAKGVFFCYSLPAKDISTDEWTEDAGFTKWYLYNIGSENIIEDSAEILEHIRCDIDTPKKQIIPHESLKEIRLKMDKHIKNTYLKSVQAPIGVNALLKTWMELS